MILTVWRHGEAGRGLSDRQRELTARGFDDIGFGCRRLQEILDLRGMTAPDLIFHSPWVRTMQTAGVIAAAFTHAPCRELAALRPGGTVQAVEAVLGSLADTDPTARHVALVSHQPLVSQLLAHFLGEDGVPPLSPGALATLQMEVAGPACGALRFWAMPPEYEAGT